MAVPAEVVHAAATAYVALCLRLQRLVPDLVDAVAVDDGLRRAVAVEPSPTAADLVREAGRLAAALPDAGLPPGRERFVAAGLRAVEWRARRLAGQAVSFAREIHECLDGVEVAPDEPDTYRAAHRELAGLLPGPGSLAARLAEHRRRGTVPPDRLGPAVRALTAALRHRVAPAFGLPPEESVDCRLVADAPWSALHTYRGGFGSVVRFATGGPVGPASIEAARLPRLVAHETYPGHHVECCHAERAVARGRVELGVTVLGSPWTVVSEGLAECGLDTAVGPRWGPWAASVLATAGVDLDAGTAERLDAVRAALRPVRLDAALLLHGAGRPTGDTRAAAEAHLRRWLLLDDARARRVVDALARPLWRTQVVAAVRGTVLVREQLSCPPLRGSDPVVAHRRLLDDPPTPQALRVRTSTQSPEIHDGR